jgi:hypothetical protein
MKMKKIALSAFILTLLVASTAASVFAQPQAVPGVYVGDTFTYQSIYYWNSTNPNDVVPAYLAAQNESTLQVTVQQVAGSTAVVEEVFTYKNGSQVSTTETDEVNSGITGTVLLYAANLTAGSLLFPGSELPYVINGTSFRDFAGEARQVNHIEVNNTGGEDTAYSYMDLYFDKQTGVLIEYYLTKVYTELPTQTTTQHLVLQDSNVWTIPEFPAALMVPLFLAASAAGLTLAVVQRKRRARDAPAA